MTAPHDPSDEIVTLRAQLAEQDRQLQTLREEVATLTRHDPLTGVMNHRTLIETLRGELLRAHRTGHPFCFAIVDLDHFSQINERFGYAVGDLVLQTVADTSLKLLRALDGFGRLGGEEFGIVLPATWLDSGVIAMTRLRAAVTACDWAVITPGMSVTFSAGLTTNATGDTAEQMLLRAEQALAKAKAEGRNRTVQSEEALPDMPPLDD
ncbi:diguanylate cyclase (GGDEF)-like protein [Actimicrobium sp. GrIS 1.19]|uniref:GGDEF domain-containing protein n=1 Tax=Actimicrobium sp. GrIS 1.19 TaxID=3071708 RepID=UPI002E05BA2E|nr:diguanylate cyclase (GGDEF)-like protein [Actimicrobium sp. GrIS 1.19]